MRLFILPMEPSGGRYTEQWMHWWSDDLAKCGFEVSLIPGHTITGSRQSAEFLDSYKIWHWKGSQIAQLAKAFGDGDIQDGDVVLTLDGWGSATTALAYFREVEGIDFHLVAYMHGGSYDPHDFLVRRGAAHWALALEMAWYRAADMILTGSAFHQQIVERALDIPPDKFFVCGAPVKLNGAPPVRAWADRDDIVVFPHRIAPEKAPEEFEMISRIYSERYDSHGVRWLRTMDLNLAKRDYYELLGSVKVAVSTAKQETFGMSMQEAISLGAWAVAPNRLAYPETIRAGEGFLYSDLEEAAVQVHHCLTNNAGPSGGGYYEDAIIRIGNEIMRRFS